MNHINDLVEFLADRNGTLDCHRDITGALVVTINLAVDPAGAVINIVGADIGKVIESSDKAHKKYLKNKSVVPLHKNQGGN